MKGGMDEAPSPASTDLHPIVRRAGRGRLPEWARADEGRRRHMGRVASLLEHWAEAREARERDRRTTRWRAAGFLHDALRDAPPDDLRRTLSQAEEGRIEEMATLPGALLHGPAAAVRLRREGVVDEELLRAVAFHTLGHPGLGELGVALYCADFLEPGRDFRNAWRGDLRDAFPHRARSVAREIARARVQHLLDEDRPVYPVTIRFWNRLVGGDR